jgi:hypothetical protein
MASDATFYVALFADEDFTEMVSDIKALKYTNSSSATVDFTGMEAGQTYYVSEVDENGEILLGGKVDEDKFTADYDDGIQMVQTPADGGIVTFAFRNNFISIPKGYMIAADLTITKNVLDPSGSAKNSNEVFYAGIFEDPEFKTLTTRALSPIVKLDLAGQSTVSETVEVGVDPDGSYELYVTEVDKDGNPVSKDDTFGYTVSVDCDSVVISEEDLEASVTITNTEKPAVTATPTPTPGVSAPASGTDNTVGSGTSTTTETPKTGDTTNATIWIMLILLAEVALIVTIIAWRRYRRTK